MQNQTQQKAHHMSDPLTIILGVGPGLGQALATRFAAGGHRIAMIARDADRLTALASDIAADSGRDVRGFSGDGTDLDNITSTMARISNDMGPADVFIHNVSCWIPEGPMDLEPSILVNEMTLGAGAALACTQAVLPGMLRQGRGTVLWTGSRMALEPAEAGPPSPALTAGKAALRGLALASAGAFHQTGINFSTITVNGGITDDGAFACSRIAETFWAAHSADRKDWVAERIFDGAD